MKIGKAPKPRQGTKPVHVDKVPARQKAPEVKVKPIGGVRVTQPGEKRRG